MSATSVAIFQGIGKILEDATKTFIVDVATDTIDTIYPWALGGLSLYIMLHGYLMIFDKANVKDGVIKMGKVVIISVFALHSDSYLNGVVSAFRGIEEGLTAAFSSSGTRSSIYVALDNSLGKGLDLVAECRQKASELSWRHMGAIIGWHLTAIIIAIGFGLVVVFGGIAILMSTIYLKILFGIGPFFIAALMFPVTARFFDAWVGFTMNHILIVALTAVVLRLCVTIYDKQISGVALDSDSQNVFGVALELLIISFILFAIVKGVTSMAAALAGGLTMSVMNLRSPRRSRLPRRGERDDSPKPTNTVTPASYEPAYKQAVRDNLRRAQERNSIGSGR